MERCLACEADLLARLAKSAPDGPRVLMSPLSERQPVLGRPLRPGADVARILQSEIADAADEDIPGDDIEKAPEHIDATLNIAARDLDALRIDPAILLREQRGNHWTDVDQIVEMRRSKALER